MGDVQAALPRRVGTFALALLPCAYLIGEVSRFYLDVPYWDEWTLAPLMWRQAAGETIGLADLAAFHNEHRPLLPRIILLALARHGGWATWPGVVTGLGLGLAGVIAAVWLLSVMTRDRGGLPWWATPAVAVILLSMNQWENWLWEWQVAIFLTLLLVLAGLAVLARGPLGPGRLVLAAAVGAAASFCFGNGLLYWPASAVLVWANGGGRRRTFLLAWTACACGVAAAYFHGYARPSGAFAVSSGARALTDLARYLGAPLANHAGVIAPVACGAAGLAGFAVLAWRTRGSVASCIAVSLAVFSVGSGALLALGRGAFLAEASVPPKYLAFANVFWLGLLGLSMAASARRWLAAPLALALVVGSTMTAVQARPLYTQRYRDLASKRDVLYSADSDAALRGFFPAPAYLKAILPRLREHRLAHFRCDDTVTRRDWLRAASAVRERAKPGDVVITSTDWASQCLTAVLLPDGGGVGIVSSGESEERLRALANGAGRFLLVAGDVASPKARTVMESAHPLSGGPRSAVRLYYWPDRIAYLTERLGERELEADLRQFSGNDLVGDGAARFLLNGWSEPEVQDGATVRRTTAPTARLYVPVLERAPSRLLLDALPLPRGRGLVVRLAVNGVPAGETRFAGGWSAATMDVANASWRHGGNIVEFAMSEEAPRQAGGAIEAAGPMPAVSFRRLHVE